MFRLEHNDSLDFVMDKQAHLYVSFGLYYFFYTYLTDVVLALNLALFTGFLYEVFQGFSTRHSGFSIGDMVYNVIGVGIAVGARVVSVSEGLLPPRVGAARGNNEALAEASCATVAGGGRWPSCHAMRSSVCVRIR